MTQQRLKYGKVIEFGKYIGYTGKELLESNMKYDFINYVEWAKNDSNIMVSLVLIDKIKAAINNNTKQPVNEKLASEAKIQSNIDMIIYQDNQIKSLRSTVLGQAKQIEEYKEIINTIKRTLLNK